MPSPITHAIRRHAPQPHSESVEHRRPSRPPASQSSSVSTGSPCRWPEGRPELQSSRRNHAHAAEDGHANTRRTTRHRTSSNPHPQSRPISTSTQRIYPDLQTTKPGKIGLSRPNPPQSLQTPTKTALSQFQIAGTLVISSRVQFKPGSSSGADWQKPYLLSRDI